jgi:hypothetical protein
LRCGPPSVAGWLLMVAFVVMRLAGQSAGLAWARRNGADPGDAQSPLESPMGALSIAVVISAQVRFTGGALPWITTSVLGGVLIGEILSQISARVRTGHTPVPPPPARPSSDEHSGDHPVAIHAEPADAAAPSAENTS